LLQINFPSLISELFRLRQVQWPTDFPSFYRSWMFKKFPSVEETTRRKACRPHEPYHCIRPKPDIFMCILGQE